MEPLEARPFIKPSDHQFPFERDAGRFIGAIQPAASFQHPRPPLERCLTEIPQVYFHAQPPRQAIRQQHSSAIGNAPGVVR
jgi:hypothetical protein